MSSRKPTFSDPDGGLRIRFTAFVGLFVSLCSGLTIAWLVDLLPVYERQPQGANLQIWQTCDLPIRVSVDVYPDYAEFDSPETPGIDSLISINIQPRDDSSNANRLVEAGCLFEFWTKHEVLDFKITETDGKETQDRQFLDFRPRVGNTPEYVVSPDPARFSGSLWLLVGDLSHRISFTDRKITASWSMFQLNDSAKADPRNERTYSIGLVLPEGYEAKSLFPRDLRLNDDRIPIFSSKVETQNGQDALGARAAITFSHPLTERLAQALLICASTLFGAGISAIMEAFLASGLLRLHRQTVQQMVESGPPTPLRKDQGPGHLSHESAHLDTGLAAEKSNAPAADGKQKTEPPHPLS